MQRATLHSTTVIGVRRHEKVALGSDGQATLGDTVMKHKAQKVRQLYEGNVLAGFAGSTADAFTLFERFEDKLKQYGGNLTRASVELAKTGAQTVTYADLRPYWLSQQLIGCYFLVAAEILLNQMIISYPLEVVVHSHLPLLVP